MTDPKQALQDIIKNIPVRDSPIKEPSVTRAELEQRAKMDAEEEAKQEAQKAYDETFAETYDEAYNRILEELLDEHGFSD